MEIPPLSNKEFTHFQKLIYELAGLHMPPVKKSLIANRLVSRLRFYQIPTYQEYYDFLILPENADEKQIFVDLLTTNETSFFREPIHFQFLSDYIVTQKKDDSVFRIWSAACSSGEEPYSIAMLLADKIKYQSWEIIASDISSRILEKSNRGLYPIDKTVNIPTEYLKKYCLKGVNSNEGFFKIANEIKSNIRFLHMNLIEPFPVIGKFKFVFLRNVMIYFDKPTRKNIIEKMHDVITENGYLFIGHSETLLGVTDKFQMIKPTIYMRK